MQAQIDALTHKWSITEHQLRNNGAIYSSFYLYACVRDPTYYEQIE